MLKPQTENKPRKLHHHSFTAPSHRGPFSSTQIRMQVPQSECAPREAGRREYGRLTEKGGLTFDPAVLVLINPLKEFVRLHYVSLYIPPDCEERRKSIRLITKTTA